MLYSIQFIPIINLRSLKGIKFVQNQNNPYNPYFFFYSSLAYAAVELVLSKRAKKMSINQSVLFIRI